MKSIMRGMVNLLLCIAIGTSGVMAYKSRKLASKIAGMSINDTRPEVVGGAAHECHRTCVEGDSRVCNYEFTLIQYSTMARACKDCPFTTADCYNRGCITAGGEVREIKVVNHMLPGPSIQVCKGDTIRVALNNAFGSDSATIHWHGMYQKNTPYMDGVPYVTQCPIQPNNAFVYNFTADPIGTHIWHSHIGLQEPDGFFGSVVVRGPSDPLARYYDFDRAEHVIMMWHWFAEPTTAIVYSTFFRSNVALGHSIIINGLTVTANYTRDGVNYTTPRANFTVTKGYRYRFRSVANTAIYCPIQVSVDNHTLLVIASDGASVEPVAVGSYIVTAGERIDFVLNANQTVGNYWIRFRGLGNCANNSVVAFAILHYEGVNYADPLESTGYANSNSLGALLNPTGLIGDFPNNHLITIADLKTTSSDAVDVLGTPDYTFYWTLGLNIYDGFQTPGPYAQIDSVSFDYPPVPFLTQYRDVTDDMFCTPNNKSHADCEDDYCMCPTIFAVELNSLVEIVIYDNTTIAPVSHPIHMHGGHFRVVAMEYGNGSLTLEDVKSRNEEGSIVKNFDTAPLKDVIAVPSQGYAVIRIQATNPGYWFVHCHVGVHSEEGMAVILKIGNDSDMTHPPDNFPKCGDYNIAATSTNSDPIRHHCAPVHHECPPVRYNCPPVYRYPVARRKIVSGKRTALINSWRGLLALM